MRDKLEYAVYEEWLQSSRGYEALNCRVEEFGVRFGHDAIIECRLLLVTPPMTYIEAIGIRELYKDLLFVLYDLLDQKDEEK